MSYPEVDRFDPVAVEEAVLARWEAEDTFRQSLAIREGAPHFVFYEGPPTANGKPGIHHVMARTIKDLFCRYKTMRGFRVDRKAGWDTHGLPVEIEVEKQLGLEGRHAVEDYGVAEYNAACRASVLKYKDLWDALTVRMGYWVDLDDPYVTFENDYVESVWNLLKRLWDKGLLYEGHKIQWYSPANGTVLSSHEVSLGYKEVQDTSVTVRFPVVGEPGTSLLAWTTTPWTLPSNAALAVAPKTAYVKVRLPLADAEGGDGGQPPVGRGARLDRRKAGRQAARRRPRGRRAPDGRGAGRDRVRAALPPHRRPRAVRTGRRPPGRRRAGRRLARRRRRLRDDRGRDRHRPHGAGLRHGRLDDGPEEEGLPVLNPIEPDGRFHDGFPLVGGMDFKAADRPILRDLRERGLLFREDSYVHNYPHDWRKGDAADAVPGRELVRQHDPHQGPDGGAQPDRQLAARGHRDGPGFGGWLENNVDWALSRSRYWGTPLPIWVETFDDDRHPARDDASQPAEPYRECIGSIEALREKVGGTFPAGRHQPGPGHRRPPPALRRRADLARPQRRHHAPRPRPDRRLVR